MRSMLTAVFVLGALVSMAQADTYKCPDGKGGVTFQSMACAVPGGAKLTPEGWKAIPVPSGAVSKRASAQNVSPAAIDDACQKMGEMAHITAQNRDKGVLLTQSLQVLAAQYARGELHPAFVVPFRALVIEIYSKTFWTPAMARQHTEVGCIQALSKLQQ
jgi:hypothetical protein